jgi:hypothetical protein
MSYPGTTKTANVPNGWTRLSQIYNADNTSTQIIVNGSKVNRVLLSCRTNAIQFAYGESANELPGTGHPMATSDSIQNSEKMWVENCFIKNETSGTVGVAVMTPSIEF